MLLPPVKGARVKHTHTSVCPDAHQATRDAEDDADDINQQVTF